MLINIIFIAFSVLACVAATLYIYTYLTDTDSAIADLRRDIVLLQINVKTDMEVMKEDMVKDIVHLIKKNEDETQT